MPPVAFCRRCPIPPIYNKVNPADSPILSLMLSSDALPLEKVNDLADTVLAQKLSEVTGVGLVSIEGNQKPAVRVQINPGAIASLGSALEDIRAVLGQNNINAPKGSFDGNRQSYAIGANDQLFSATEYGGMVIAFKNGAPITAPGRGKCHGRCREYAACRVGRFPACCHTGYPETTRSKYYRDGGSCESAAA